VGQAMKHGSDARMDGLGSRAGEGAGDRSCWLSRLRRHSYARLDHVVKACEIMKTRMDAKSRAASQYRRIAVSKCHVRRISITSNSRAKPGGNA